MVDTPSSSTSIFYVYIPFPHHCSPEVLHNSVSVVDICTSQGRSITPFLNIIVIGETLNKTAAIVRCSKWGNKTSEGSEGQVLQGAAEVAGDV